MPTEAKTPHNTKRYQVTRPELPTGIYRHYKGGFYLLLGIAAHSETDELYVVYVAMAVDREGPRMRVRPLEMFMERVRVPTSDGTDTLLVPRFEWMGNYFVYGPTDQKSSDPVPDETLDEVDPENPAGHL